MSVPSILLPVFAQVALTFVLMLWMARARLTAISRGEVSAQELQRDWTSWPQRPTQISAAYHNQFQLPLLFYLLVLIAFVTTQADFLFVVLSWLFVAMRLVHAYIHTGRNEIRMRFRAFALGASILLVMWIYVFLKLYLGL